MAIDSIRKVLHKLNEAKMRGSFGLEWELGPGLPKQIFVVTNPTKNSELMDISFGTTIVDLMLQARGGLDAHDVVGVYKSKAEADKVASEILRKRDAGEYTRMRK